MAYSKGLHDLGDGCHAWLQPDGGWGWSNSGLVTGGGDSLLVDTLFDLVTTRQMLDGIRPLTDRAPLTTVVNTHSVATIASATSWSHRPVSRSSPPLPRPG